MKKKMGLLLVCALCCFSVQAEVYKWVDENGKAHFGDKAPKEKSAEKIDHELENVNIDHASKNSTYSTSTSNKTQDEKDLDLKKKMELEQAIGDKCLKRKKDISAIGKGVPGRFIDENGKEEIVLEKDRSKKLDEMKNNYRQSPCQQLYPLEEANELH